MILCLTCLILHIFVYWSVAVLFFVYYTCAFCLYLCIYHVYMHVNIFFCCRCFCLAGNCLVWFFVVFLVYLCEVLNVLRHHWVSEVSRNRQPRVSLLWASILRRLLCFLLYESALQVLSGHFKDPNTHLNGYTSIHKQKTKN